MQMSCQTTANILRVEVLHVDSLFLLLYRLRSTLLPNGPLKFRNLALRRFGDRGIISTTPSNNNTKVIVSSLGTEPRRRVVLRRWNGLQSGAYLHPD